ncbi:MAG: RNA 3'-terminal phosphate cyclase [Anaerolineae bacterium]|nr:MAG: RNA 3'-terminal phosphate cyclase [Anaerolineae bacterium]
MLHIDGTHGEGGGQLLRTSLTLSVLTGRPFRMDNIRAGRPKPGLRPQHLTAVRAAAALCQAKTTGAHLNSVALEFHPGARLRGGSYRFDVSKASASGRSAGAVTLIIQTLLWPLIFAQEASFITLVGGTFVPFSPPYHYFKHVAGPVFKNMGADFTSKLMQWGWMSRGGGQVELSINPSGSLKAVRLEPENVDLVTGVAAVTNLPSHIPQRMTERAGKLVREQGLDGNIKPIRERGNGPGAGMVLWIPQAGFSSLGRPGLPAEEVANSAVADLLSFMENGAAVDKFLADQILVPMALANGSSTFSTSLVSTHTVTNADLLRQWLNIDIEVKGVVGEPGQITVEGIGFSNNA